MSQDAVGKACKPMTTTNAKKNTSLLDPKRDMEETQSGECNEEVLKLDLAKVCGIDMDSDNVSQEQANDQCHKDVVEICSEEEKEPNLKKQVLDDVERLLQKGKEEDEQEPDASMKKEASKVKEELEEDSTDERKKLIQSEKDDEDGGIEMNTLNKMYTQDEATSSV